MCNKTFEMSVLLIKFKSVGQVNESRIKGTSIFADLRVYDEKVGWICSQ